MLWVVWKYYLNFVESPEILNILVMAKTYNQRPSNIIGLDNDYQAYCFDEACIFLYNALQENKTLHFAGDKKESQKPKHYKSFGEFYNSLGVR